MLHISFHILLCILLFDYGILICLPYDTLVQVLVDILGQHGVDISEEKDKLEIIN